MLYDILAILILKLGNDCIPLIERVIAVVPYNVGGLHAAQ